jgi:hypothetical protein
MGVDQQAFLDALSAAKVTRDSGIERKPDSQQGGFSFGGQLPKSYGKNLRSITRTGQLAHGTSEFRPGRHWHELDRRRGARNRVPFRS